MAKAPKGDPVYQDLSPEEYARVMELLGKRAISYEYDAADPTWFRLYSPTPEDVTKVEAALADGR